MPYGGGDEIFPHKKTQNYVNNSVQKRRKIISAKLNYEAEINLDEGIFSEFFSGEKKTWQVMDHLKRSATLDCIYNKKELYIYVCLHLSIAHSRFKTKAKMPK